MIFDSRVYTDNSNWNILLEILKYSQNGVYYLHIIEVQNQLLLFVFFYEMKCGQYALCILIQLHMLLENQFNDSQLAKLK